MNLHMFYLVLFVILMFFWTIKSSAAAVLSIQQLLKVTDNIQEIERLKMIYRCPFLDPCKVGDKYMELFEYLRKAVDCPPQPQRCSMTTSTLTINATTSDTQPATTITEPSLNSLTVLWCLYMQANFGDKTFFQKYGDMLKAIECPTNSTQSVTHAIANITTIVFEKSNETFTPITFAIDNETSTTIMSTITNKTDTMVLPAIVNVTNSTVMPAVINVISNIAIIGAEEANEGRNNSIVVQKSSLGAAILEALSSVFRKFHY